MAQEFQKEVGSCLIPQEMALIPEMIPIPQEFQKGVGSLIASRVSRQRRMVI
jgi:hypothetical protein